MPLPDVAAIRPEVHHHYYPTKPKHFNFGKLSFGLFLIIVGLLYLAKNLGWLNLEFNLDLWRLWPLLIVFAGLSMLTSRNLASIFAGIVLTLTVLTITLILIVGPTDYSINLITTDKNQQNGSPPSAAWTTTPINLNADLSTESAAFNIKSNLSELTIGGGSDRLLSGALHSDFATVALDSQTDGPAQNVNLEIKPKISLFQGRLSQAQLQLNSQLAANIYLESLASSIDFKLADLSSELITINAAASNIKLDLNNSLSRAITLSAKASEVTLTLPADQGLRLNLHNPQEIKSDKLEKVDNLTYQTLGYDQAAEKIVLSLDLAATDVNIQ